MAQVDWHELEAWVTDALRGAEFPCEQAQAIAWGLCEAEAGGIETHGVVRTLQYVESAARGDIRVDASPELVSDTHHPLYDASGGYGFLPMRNLVDRLCGDAEGAGVAIGGVRNSHHYGAGWVYAARAARAGCGAIVMTNSSANLAGPGSRRAVMGNNPLSIAVPGPPDRGPVCADIAMSTVAQGHIRLAARMGRRIPTGWARDADGNATEDPEAALAARMLEPIGQHKGWVLAVLVELLAGALTGSPFGTASSAHANADGGVGHFAIVFRTDLFTHADDLVAAVGQLHNEVREAADDAPEATLPGWREEARRRSAVEHGIEVDDRVLERLDALKTVAGRPCPPGEPGQRR